MSLKLALCLFVAVCALQSTFAQSEVCGGEVAIEDYPHQLSFLVQGTPHCGATLISDRHAILPASCLSKIPEEFVLSLHGGSVDPYIGGSNRTVGWFVVHAQYGAFNRFDNDAAILTVTEPFELGPTIQPVSLPVQDDFLNTGDLTTVAAWDFGENSKLEKISFPILDAESVCKEIYFPGLFSDNMYCAGRVEGGIETCKTSRSSSMLVDNTLVGIMTFGGSEERPDYPSAFAKIAGMRDWINAATGV